MPRLLADGPIRALATLMVACALTGVAGAAPKNEARARASELLGSTYLGTWACKWEPAEIGLTTTITHAPTPHSVDVSLAFEDGARESEVYTYDAARGSWSVFGETHSRRSPNSFDYHLHDVANPPDDQIGLVFEGSAQRLVSGKKSGAPLPLREVLYLSGDEWYHWRFVKNKGRWVPYGRRACGRGTVPSI
jgi:hypothetical protein